MTPAKWEKSSADKKVDATMAKRGIKEGSKADEAADKKGIASANRKRK